jgi:hypothetical protein
MRHCSAFLFRWWLLAACCALVAACAPPGSVKPTLKVGLSAPFEGLHRDLGYEALNAVRLAVRQRNAEDGVGNSYYIELVALNDFNEPEEAVRQARKMAVDPGVLGVLGGWSMETSRAAAQVYHQLGLAYLSPGSDWTQGGPLLSESVDQAFEADYRVLSGGASPGPVAVWAYQEANRLLDALDAVVRSGSHPTRASVMDALAQ